MDMAHILNQVKSPFTDEEIEKLIKIYIECNCSMDEFYKRINLNVEKEEKTITEAETLIDMQNSKEGQNIGE